MKQTKKKTKKTSVKVPSQETINVEILQIDRIQAINNLSLAVLETARALNAPSVMVRNNTFLGGSPALSILQRRKK